MAKLKRVDLKKPIIEYEPDIKKTGSAQTGSAQLDKIETAAYISDIVLQLRNMAKAADLKFLVYFLEMAFQEAFSQSTRNENSKNSKS